MHQLLFHVCTNRSTASSTGMTATYPARAHALKVIKKMAHMLPEADLSKTHGIFVQAAPVMCRHDTDRELPFHQEANFRYLTGCPTPSASVFVLFSFPTSASADDPKIHHQLLIPRADPAETMWSVAPPTLEESKDRFDSDKISYLDELKHVLDEAQDGAKECILHTLPNTVLYPALPSTVLNYLDGGAAQVKRSTDHLLEALQHARLTKDEFEIGLIRKANQISSEAHEVVMRELGKHTNRGSAVSGRKSSSVQGGPGNWTIGSEGDAEALFTAVCRRAGAGPAYLPIVASGSRSSTLHYVCNDRLFPATALPRQPGDTSFSPRQLQRGCCGGDEHDHADGHEHESDSLQPQVLLIDAGCEWEDYASDITRVTPIGNNGKFTDRAGKIYDVVLRMQKECEAMVKPGAHWDDLHLHAHTVLVDEFLRLGIFVGSKDDILASGVTAAFFPHGLGHSLGLDVHDSLQFLRNVHVDIPQTSTPAKLFAYLRIRRPLELGMVLTVEPGCYFAPQLMEEHGVWTSPFIVKDKLEEYTGMGGVRLEDVVVVREGKCENLTTVGRDRSWVEQLCSGEQV